MNPFQIFLVLVLLGFSSVAKTETPLPRFESYRVEENYTRKAVQPVIRTREDRQYRTMLSEAAGKKANFAGHYVVSTWGCGASCVMGVIVDAKTGKVYWLPFTVAVDINEFEPIVFRRDSSLIVVKGSRNEKGHGAYYYNFTRDHLALVRAIETPPAN